ncbi:hypothetical protein AX16_002038 [Volvariella volvacea WC 439]|nr:hypothetical protein AX16_002038 [Volvariella volvacea WC 439]
MPNPSTSTDSSFDITTLTRLHLTNPNQRDTRLLSEDSFDDHNLLGKHRTDKRGLFDDDDDSLYLTSGSAAKQPFNLRQGKGARSRDGSRGSSKDLGSRAESSSDTFRLTRTEHGGDDLKLSELSLEDKTITMDKPFSFFARPDDRERRRDEKGKQRQLWQDDDHGEDDAEEQEYEEAAEEEEDQEQQQLEEAQKRRLAAKSREEKLQKDLFMLRKLNSSFSVFHEALQDVTSANDRIATQFQHTDALLNKYISLLTKSEEVSRLIFDEDWWGVHADLETIERRRIEEEEKARREEEERQRQAQLELEQRMREEQERREQEERERAERERKEKSAIGRGSSSGVRGVRGTRASMRGVRGTAPPTRISPGSGTSSTRGRPTSTTSGTGSGSGLKRPSSAASTSAPSSAATRGPSAYRRP